MEPNTGWYTRKRGLNGAWIHNNSQTIKCPPPPFGNMQGSNTRAHTHTGEGISHNQTVSAQLQHMEPTIGSPRSTLPNIEHVFTPYVYIHACTSSH